LANKPIEFDRSLLMQVLNMSALFTDIESSNERTFEIPKCPNCGDLIRQLDLEALAESCEKYRAVDLINDKFGRSLIAM